MPTTPTVPAGTDYLCRAAVGAAVGAASVGGAVGAAACPAAPGPPRDPGLHKFADTDYSYCTGVPGTTDEVVYRDWVTFYDDPRKTGQTFPKDPDLAYNRVGNVTGAGCFISGDKPIYGQQLLARAVHAKTSTLATRRCCLTC